MGEKKPTIMDGLNYYKLLFRLSFFKGVMIRGY